MILGVQPRVVLVEFEEVELDLSPYLFYEMSS